MADIAYVNGAYVPRKSAGISIEDRGYQFADGVYEVCLVIDGCFWDFEGHMKRLDYSLGELRIARPCSDRALSIIMQELLRRNQMRDALIYLQVTRGVARRNHAFPKEPVAASVVITANRFSPRASDTKAQSGISVITTDDIRWGRVNIKTISLLPNALAKQEAYEHGAEEAWLIKDGLVTEGSSSNAWIVTSEDELITHPKGNPILSGITRQTLFACAAHLGLKVQEKAFSPGEALRAKEAFITSATALVMPVISINNRQIGDGKPGEITKMLRYQYKKYVTQVAEGRTLFDA